MKKMMFLMLTLFFMGTASMNAQVKIGGDGTTGPVAGAVLELDGAQGALVLPRVAALPAVESSVEGMQVYLTSKDSVYIFDGSKWNVYAGPAGATGPKGADGAPADVSAVPGTIASIVHVRKSGKFPANGSTLGVPLDTPWTVGKSFLVDTSLQIASTDASMCYHWIGDYNYLYIACPGHSTDGLTVAFSTFVVTVK